MYTIIYKFPVGIKTTENSPAAPLEGCFRRVLGHFIIFKDPLQQNLAECSGVGLIGSQVKV